MSDISIVLGILAIGFALWQIVLVFGAFVVLAGNPDRRVTFGVLPGILATALFILAFLVR